MFENTIELGEIFSIRNIIIYLLVINLIGFYVMWSDKRKAKYGKWRIPEHTIFVITALGGGIGTVAGMYVFRHKTQKPKFFIGLPTILVLEILLVIYFLWL